MSFKLSGIKVTVSYPAVAMLCLALFTSYNGDVMIPLCLLACVLHESGHLLFICKFIGKPHSITIKPGEVCINCNTSDVSFKQEQIITCAGVAFNFTTSLISYMFYSFVPISICLDFAICNLCIGIFNLLPVRTFDGGQLIYNALLRKYSLKATEIVTNILTVLIVIPLATAGFYILLISKFNYTLLIVAIYTVSIIITKEMR